MGEEVVEVEKVETDEGEKLDSAVRADDVDGVAGSGRDDDGEEGTCAGGRDVDTAAGEGEACVVAAAAGDELDSEKNEAGRLVLTLGNTEETAATAGLSFGGGIIIAAG